jgi:transposase/macrodomain Ter protein organizer (MatP/YcbG family)
MRGFVQGADRQQTTLFPECLDDWVDESNSIRAVDVFVDALELRDLGFDGVDPAATGRPAYHPSPMLKLYIYGYLNRVQSSRRLEREAGRNLEVMWLTGRLAPDHKTIADFRKDNGPAIKKVCAQFVELCRKMGLLTKASVATNVGTDRSQLAKMAQAAKSTLRSENLDVVADRGYFKGEEILACEQVGIAVTLPKPQTSGAKSAGRFGKSDFVYLAKDDVYRCPAGEKLAHHFTADEDGQKMRIYLTKACRTCPFKDQCTTSNERRIKRWEHEHVVEAAQTRLDQNPQAMRVRRETAEHPFATLKMRMGATHFLMKRLPNVSTEMALNVLAYNLTRVMNIVGIKPLLVAIRA